MSTREIEELMQEAEKCHTAMYEARPHNIKDLRDDALMYLSRAKNLAHASGEGAKVREIEIQYERVNKSYAQLRT